MSKKYKRLYSESDEADSAYFITSGSVYFFASDVDKYVINGKNLIAGATELIMRHLLDTEAGRVETALIDSDTTVKRIPAEKFLAGMDSYSFVLNASMVLARQVKLTNRIINANLEELEGDEKKTREYSIEYYLIIERILSEFRKRKLPWLKDIITEFETSLTCKRGEAYYRSSEPVRIDECTALSERDMEYQRGMIICEEGTPGGEMYILRSGAIDVMVGDNSVASIEDPGTVIGEMALLLGEKRTATLKAKNNVVVTSIRKEDLRDIAERQGDLLKNIVKVLAKRHYYNIIKINSINRSVIEHALNEEDKSENKQNHSQRAQKDLRALKNHVEDIAGKKEADFLDDLIQGF